MHENTFISNQPQINPGAWDGRAGHSAQHHELEPELNEKLPIQLKLSVGATNDPLEDEADAMADKIMRMSETSFIQRKAGCGCSYYDQDDEHVRLKPMASQVSPFIQTKSDGNSPVSDSLSGRIQSTRGGGSPMQGDTKSFMENRFGTDFNDVKIHNNDESAQLNRSLNAKAFTVSNNIYFNSGQYQPETDSGKHLLAHELTHTIQQSGIKGAGSSAVIRRTPADDARALAKKIHDAISAAKADEAAVLTALGTLGRDATKASLLKTTYKTEHTTELEADIKLKLSAANSSRALFLLNGPPAETGTASTATVDKAGTEDHKANIGTGGKVSVHTGTDFKGGSAVYPGGFSLGYSGDKANETRYIQTLWSEVIATQPDKTETRVAKSGLGTSNGTMELTTDVSKPKYKIDSASATSPFYESGFTHIRTATGNTNYDRPSEFSDVILKQFDAGATKVVEIDHFDNFLIQEEKTIYMVSLYVQWVYTSKTAVTRTTKFVSGSPIAALPAEVKKQLVKEYPKFEYIS